MTRFSYAYPRPAVTVDCAVFGYDPTYLDPSLKVLLVKRGRDPFKGKWALPGGFVEVSDVNGRGESLDAAAHRELQEETGIEVNYLEQLYTFGDQGRDPRGRTISVAYYALVRTMDHPPIHGSDADGAGWYSMTFQPRNKDLAFDHTRILYTALARLQAKIQYALVGLNLLPERFTLPDLRRLYEAILMRKLDAGNFRRVVGERLEKKGVLVPDGEMKTRASGPAGRLYRFNEKAYIKATEGRVRFDLI